jgi:hypothetical protein
MLRPALDRSDDAESFNPRNEGPLIAGASSDGSGEAGVLARAVTTGVIGGGATGGTGVAACAGGGAGFNGFDGFDARCDAPGGTFAETGSSVAPHMLQKRFVA